MMTLDYIKTDPTKNITALVTTPVPPERQAAAAEALMARLPDCEQVGFVGESAGCDAALRMMGGEFCGNASLSLGAVLAQRQGREGTFTLRVSGADGPVTVDITKEHDGWRGRVSMPLPTEIRRVEFGRCAADVVFFPGIAHAFPTVPLPVPLAEMLIREWAAALGAEALGVMLMDGRAGTLTPVVYVRSTDTVVRESSCASGTAAAAALAALKNGRASLTLKEPGGALSAEAEAREGRITALSLTGSVRILGRGSVTPAENS
ncbi:MAG TPA: hypothetical protein PKN39_05960 [Oscillospiraceae bacterium]|nr:hypothetical protein [Oscillospiraceae bacterium]